VQAAGSVGTVTETHSGTVALTGVSATGSSGTVTPSGSGAVALTGVSATGAVGTPVVLHAQAITGHQVASSFGTLGSTRTVALSGIQAAGSTGTLVASGGQIAAAYLPDDEYFEAASVPLYLEATTTDFWLTAVVLPAFVEV
jgi:hypothetical protein